MVIYHCHTDLSLLDSCSKFQEYVDLAVQQGMNALGCSEHGRISNWAANKLLCKQNGMKYLHACEVYLTSCLDNKVRDNYHTVLLAKNPDGFHELNRLIELSTRPDHFYYNNRISAEEFLAISPNIIKISACLASPLAKLARPIRCTCVSRSITIFWKSSTITCRIRLLITSVCSSYPASLANR